MKLPPLPAGCNPCSAGEIPFLSSAGFACVAQNRSCALPNATGTQAFDANAGAYGACTIASCNAGYADCDGVATDGCEAILATDASNCGACGNACGAGLTCSSGACSAALPCKLVNGIRWCYEPTSSRGVGCAAFCSSLGLPLTIDDATWFAAQDTTSGCQAIADAFGLPLLSPQSAYVNDNTFACAEYNPKIGTGTVLCSTNAQCPAAHRGGTDLQAQPICPCQ